MRVNNQEKNKEGTGPVKIVPKSEFASHEVMLREILLIGACEISAKDNSAWMTGYSRDSPWLC